MNDHASSDNGKRDYETISTTFLERVKGMRPEAWARLVDIYGAVVYRWCRQSGLNEHDAADVVQDVFSSVARSIDRFRREQTNDSFRGWLATITRNRIRDLARRQKIRPSARGGTEANLYLANVPEPEEASTSHDLSAMVSQRALDVVRAEFEEKTWTCFWRTTIDDRSPADVAEEMGVSVAVVYQARSRVLRRLRRQLKELPEQHRSPAHFQREPAAGSEETCL